MESGFESLSPSHLPSPADPPGSLDPSRASLLRGWRDPPGASYVRPYTRTDLTGLGASRSRCRPSSACRTTCRRVAALAIRGHGIAARAGPSAEWTGRREERRTMLKLAYVVVSLVPTAAVVALAWYVVRAISVRVVWRETGSPRA